jgi:hypothetical protein
MAVVSSLLGAHETRDRPLAVSPPPEKVKDCADPELGERVGKSAVSHDVTRTV